MGKANGTKGEDVALETRNAADGYLTSSSTEADFPVPDRPGKRSNLFGVQRGPPS
jgi:hypothetical protein